MLVQVALGDAVLVFSGDTVLVYRDQGAAARDVEKYFIARGPTVEETVELMFCNVIVSVTVITYSPSASSINGQESLPYILPVPKCLQSKCSLYLPSGN